MNLRLVHACYSSLCFIRCVASHCVLFIVLYLLLVVGVADASSLLSNTGSSSQLTALQQQLAVLIGTSASNVDILSIQNSPDSPGSVDVTFAAHGSPYYTSEKLNSLVAMNGNAVSAFHHFFYGGNNMEYSWH